jgi:hypothetical protein
VLSDFDRVRVERFKQATQEKLRHVRCPEHHRPPRVRFQGNSIRDISVSVSGCCSKVMEIANAEISGAGARAPALEQTD